MQSNRDGTPSVKKPRPKQQVQDIDVENLARSNQVSDDRVFIINSNVSGSPSINYY